MQAKHQDQAIVERIKSGEMQALDEVYLQYKPDFEKWVRHHFPLFANTIEDIYHEIIIKFYNNIASGKYVEARSSLKTYLFAIGKYEIYDRTRAKQKKRELDERFFPDIPEEVEDESYQEEMVKQMQSQIDHLSDRCRTLVRYYYFEARSIEEITELMDFKSKKQTSQEKWRCLSKLKSLLR